MKAVDKIRAQATFEGYDGPRLWAVNAPGHEALTVSAPDENAAIVAAAKKWKERWQQWEFYSSCDVRKLS